jgi:DNA helicase-2/ATP-dependent DNA helicase PcrA
MLHGQSRYNIQSRFIDEIPADLLAWLSPQRLRARALDLDDWRTPATTTTMRAPKETPAGPAWRIGQSVRHAKFGVGVIVDSEGRGSDARVQVNFRDAGLKWLALEYAKLEAA